MAMPVVIEFETISGIKDRISLPVEVWQNNVSLKARIPSKELLARVTIDPDKVFPDFDEENNNWSSEQLKK
jgi:hypothetical protein